jgi:hypothetical protein
MRAYCGLDCGSCGAYTATANNDDAARERVAAEWGKAFGHHVTTADINCLGCASESGPWYQYCSACGIRACAHERQVPNCAHCDDYVCDTLRPFVGQAPAAWDWLNAERARVGKG